MKRILVNYEYATPTSSYVMCYYVICYYVICYYAICYTHMYTHVTTVVTFYNINYIMIYNLHILKMYNIRGTNIVCRGGK